jgi:histidyl-tRNA synthetase
MKKPLSFHEIMPDDVWKWKYMESQIEQVLNLFNYREIRLSVLQDNEVLYKGVTALLDTEEAGEITDQIISLNQPDSNVSLLSLRPEGTINVLNHVANSMPIDKIHRLYYHGNMFRKDEQHRPHEFYQLGVELLGSESILSENEVISLGVRICKQLGLKDAKLEINSFGCETCRPQYFSAMRKFLAENKDEYCASCFEALNHNPFHPTDCLKDNCMHSAKQGPAIHEFLCKKCIANFDKVKKIQANLGIEYVVNHNLVKNFSYYNETVFNFVLKTNGHSEIIGGGGRYDYLSGRITGKKIPAVGFYFDLDLVYKVMTARNLFLEPASVFKVYISPQSENLEIMLLQIVQELHENEIPTVISTDISTTEKDTENAVRNGCSLMIILRDDNLRDGKVLVKNLMKEKQEYIPLSDLLREIEMFRKAVQ